MLLLLLSVVVGVVDDDEHDGVDVDAADIIITTRPSAVESPLFLGITTCGGDDDDERVVVIVLLVGEYEGRCETSTTRNAVTTGKPPNKVVKTKRKKRFSDLVMLLQVILLLSLKRVVIWLPAWHRVESFYSPSISHRI
jgi:hypothetical protein